jgi:hypothetical protein
MYCKCKESKMMIKKRIFLIFIALVLINAAGFKKQGENTGVPAIDKISSVYASSEEEHSPHRSESPTADNPASMTSFVIFSIGILALILLRGNENS